MAGALPGSDHTMSDSGWSNSIIFQDYLSKHFAKHVPLREDEYTLVMYDGATSHINVALVEWAREHKVILFVLPAHTSHLLQPLDVGCFGPFKSELIDDGDKCCQCNLFSPTGLKHCPNLTIVNWAACDNCTHWVHLRFCVPIEVIGPEDSFVCPCCAISEE